MFILDPTIIGCHDLFIFYAPHALYLIYYDLIWNLVNHTISCIDEYVWPAFFPKMILRDLHIKSKLNVHEEGSGTGH